MRVTIASVLFFLLSWLPLPGIGAAEVTPEILIDGLDNPCGLAIQPETGHLFVAESGAGRVIRIVDKKIQEVVVGYPLDEYGKGPKFKIGPLGLGFRLANTLIVADGGFPDGEECVRVFEVPAVGQPAIKFDTMQAKLGPLVATDQVKGEGNFFGLALNATGLFVSCNGDDAKGWIAKADINGTKFGELKRFIATKETVDVDAPTALTLSPNGDLVVGQMGELEDKPDSMLTFYHPATGKSLLSLQTGLRDITALAYSPQRQLFALDFSWSKPEDAGLFQIVAERRDGQQAARAIKVCSLHRPTAMTFGKDGELYVAVIGADPDKPKSGSVLRIRSGL